MIIRIAKMDDFDKVFSVINIAKKSMYLAGNFQWKKDYPSEDIIRQDIRQKYCYVCESNNHIIASFSFIPGPDPTYEVILNGEWINDQPYYVIHRIASSGEVKGIGEIIIKYCKDQCKNIRIDTHSDNTVMQYLLDKLNFQYCGIIYTSDGTQRLAYQSI